MKTLKLIVALSVILLLASVGYPQGAPVSFRTGILPMTWCPIMGPGGTDPLPDGSYVMVILAGGNGAQDPVGTGGVPTGDDVQPTGNNIDHIALHVGESPLVPPGNMYQSGNTLGFLDPGFGTEPCANIGDLMYLRAFNAPDPATATHANDMITVGGTPQTTYTPPGPAPVVIVVCFGEAYPFGAPPPCVPQETGGPEAAMISMGSTHYFFGETEESHCTLWIEATGGYVDVTEAVLIDAEPPCKPVPATTYMTRYYELSGVPESFFDVYFGYSQTDYDASDFGTDETQLHVAYWEGDLVGCVGEWVKVYPIPALITDTPEGGYAQVTTDHLSLWSFGWGDGEQQLPVNLTSFEALAGDRSAVLNWTTASEQDNAGFHIERSTDGENFMRVTNQMIEGAGTSSNNNDYTYTDSHLNNGVHYTYRLIDVDINGYEYINEITAEVTPSFLGEAIVITEYKLHQNYPNPFNPTTNIVYDVLDQGMVTLKVYNVMGQEVTELVHELKDNGRYATAFNSAGLSSGIYFYTVKVNNFTDTKKMLLVQ